MISGAKFTENWVYEIGVGIGNVYERGVGIGELFCFVLFHLISFHDPIICIYLLYFHTYICT